MVLKSTSNNKEGNRTPFQIRGYYNKYFHFKAIKLRGQASTGMRKYIHLSAIEIAATKVLITLLSKHLIGNGGYL